METETPRCAATCFIESARSNATRCSAAATSSIVRPPRSRMCPSQGSHQKRLDWTSSNLVATANLSSTGSDFTRKQCGRPAPGRQRPKCCRGSSTERGGGQTFLYVTQGSGTSRDSPTQVSSESLGQPRHGSGSSSSEKSSPTKTSSEGVTWSSLVIARQPPSKVTTIPV